MQYLAPSAKSLLSFATNSWLPPTSMFALPPNMDDLNNPNKFPKQRWRFPWPGGPPKPPPYGGGGGAGEPFPMYGWRRHEWPQRRPHFKRNRYGGWKGSYGVTGSRLGRGGAGSMLARMLGAGRGGRRQYKRGGRFRKLRPEKKFRDATVSITQSGSTESKLTLMVTIPQGLTEITRLGREAILTSILFNFRTVPTVNSTDVDFMSLRRKVYLIQDTNPNGAIFGVTDFLVTDHIDSYRNLDNAKRFKVLFHRSDVFNPQADGDGTLSDSAQVCNYFRANVKCCISMEFDDTNTNGAVDTQTTNSVYLLTLIDTLDNNSRGMFMSGRKRIRWIG